VTNGILIREEIEDSGIRAKLMALIALGMNPAPALRDIAAYGESSTRERFRLQISPEGNRWKPLKTELFEGGFFGKKHLRKDGRIRKSAINRALGRKILTRDGHLGDSITAKSSSQYAEWGTNRIYAAIHQFGGKAGRGRKVTIPARPYLGVNDENAADILNLLADRIEGAR
jgi:phage virion morphogenesis protein